MTYKKAREKASERARKRGVPYCVVYDSIADEYYAVPTADAFGDPEWEDCDIELEIGISGKAVY